MPLCRWTTNSRAHKQIYPFGVYNISRSLVKIKFRSRTDVSLSDALQRVLLMKKARGFQKYLSPSWRTKDVSELVSELAGCRVSCLAVWQRGSSPLCKRENRNEINNKISKLKVMGNKTCPFFLTLFLWGLFHSRPQSLATLSANDIIKQAALGTRTGLLWNYPRNMRRESNRCD